MKQRGFGTYMAQMSLQEVYTRLDGDYDAVCKRLMRETLVWNFLESFLEDPEYEKLEIAMRTHDDDAAFAAAHTLKSVAMNMEFGALARSAIALTEALRNGRKPETDALFARVQADYAQTVGVIRESLQQ